MEKDNNSKCTIEIDYLHHMLNEQITRICVEEEEERIREEIKKEKL